jgi:AraC-like DNA-binding protein
MPSSLVRTFSDPDQYVAAMQATKAEVTITGRGHFAAKLTRIQLHDLWMQRYAETLPRVAHAGNVRGRAIISFRTEPGPALSWGGAEMLAGSLTRHSEGQEAFQQSTGAASFGSMSLPIDVMVSAGAALLGSDLAPPRDGLTVTPTPAAMARLLHLHEAVAKLAETVPGILANPEAARGAEQALVDAMVLCLDGAEARTERVAQQHQAVIMRRFWRVLEERPDRAHYIGELCATIGVSDRTLRACCQEHLGMGPRRYLALRRMHLARRALRHGVPAVTTVTEIAAQHGFWQFGRFAGEYHHLFGEFPSATLAREPA